MSEKILIVDDDPETVQILNLMLARLGYQALVAKDGMEALSLARSELPDLILLDVMMPGLDGFEVARSLRRHPSTALIPILILTAKTQIDDKVAGYDAGADIYLTKPIHPVDLYANIKTLLAQRRERTISQAKKGHTVGVLAAKGGLGVSTTALNLAIAYHQNHGVKVIAAEMRPGQGSWAEELKLTNPSALATLLRKESKDISTTAVEKQLISTSYGVFLLLASHSSGDTECMTAIVQYEAILLALTALASLVILDIGTIFHPAFNTLVESCNEIVMVVEPQIITTRLTRLMIDELRERDIGGAKPLTVAMVNHSQSSMNLNVSQVEEILGQPSALGFPHAAELAHLAATRSAPMILLQPEGMITRQFKALADLVDSHIEK
jgi:CheY-like chemotaxis protein